MDQREKQLLDIHEERAKELADLGLCKQAKRVRGCGVLLWPSGKWSCKQRFCPSCGPRRARQQAARHYRNISSMSTPVLALFSVSSTRIKDLRETVAILMTCLRRIRARVVFRPVLAEAGSIEVALA